VLNALVNRQYGKVTCVGKSAGTIHQLEITQDLRIPVTVDPDPIDKIGPR
jgi:hypothetical protein